MMLTSFVLANCRPQLLASQLIAGQPQSEWLQGVHCHRNLCLGRPFSHPHLAMSPQSASSPYPLGTYHQLFDMLVSDELAIHHAHEHCC